MNLLMFAQHFYYESVTGQQYLGASYFKNTSLSDKRKGKLTIGLPFS